MVNILRASFEKASDGGSASGFELCEYGVGGESGF
jgi:hypothetical protein